jgi:endopeptidase La
MEEKKYKRVPTVALRGLVAFPNTVIHFDITRAKSMQAIERAMADDEKIFLVAQNNYAILEPELDDLYRYGTYCRIKQVVRTNNKNTMRVIVEGLERYELLEIVKDDSYLISHIRSAISDTLVYEDSNIPGEAKEAMLRVVKDLLGEFISKVRDTNIEKIKGLLHIDILEELLLKVANDFVLDYKVKQEVLENDNLEEIYEILVSYIIKENEIITIKQNFQHQLREQIDKNQKEYVLREQLKLIQNELGDSSPVSEADTYEEKLEKLHISKEAKDKVMKEISRLRAMPSGSQELNVIRNYLETVFDIPWNKKTKDNTDIKKAASILDEEHYGLEKVKERIIEYLAVRMLNPNGHSPILCLVGPPGTGKTSIAKSVANALNKKYIRISLGGVRDEAEIRGHRKTYIGAMPGRLVDGLRQAKVNNPLMLLDEIDKSSSDYKGDISSALLEVLDPAQNHAFRDNYVEIPIDLSKVLFIATANSISTIPRPLLDRMELIEISSYTENEKFHIAKDYLLKKQLLENGLDSKNVSITDEALKKIIHNYTREAGVRNLERQIGNVFRKCARKVLEGRKTKIVISPKKIEEFLGKEKVSFELANEKDEIGIVRGLAWTSVGGDTLQIEVNLIKGAGKLVLTGQMGDVMKESANIAYTCVKSLADTYKIDIKDFEDKDVHLHIPAGAVPKDGPSAGITMTTAILSAFTNKKVRKDVAMTGEVTLRGRVLPIGGLKEKLLAAKLAGMKTVIVPKKNKLDVEEISKEILDKLEIVYADEIKEVLDLALI